ATILQIHSSNGRKVSDISSQGFLHGPSYFIREMDTVAFPVTRICTKTKITKLIIGEYMKERTISRLVQGINLMISNVRDGIEHESGQRQGDGSQINAITNPGLSRHSTSSESGSELQSTEDHTRSARKRSWLAESTQQQRKKTKRHQGQRYMHCLSLKVKEGLRDLFTLDLNTSFPCIHEIPLSNLEPSPAASRDKSIIVMVSENKNDGGHPLKIKGNKEEYPGIKAAKPTRIREFDGRMDTVAFPVTRICTKTKITKLIIGEYMKERTISRLVQGINLMISNVRDGIERKSGQRQGDGSQINAITNPGLSRHSTSSESGSELQSTEDHMRSARKRSWLAESTQLQRKKTKRHQVK
ncbi:unnamed protein product, partial [Darwinula stevensoni]